MRDHGVAGVSIPAGRVAAASAQANVANVANVAGGGFVLSAGSRRAGIDPRLIRCFHMAVTEQEHLFPSPAGRR